MTYIEWPRTHHSDDERYACLGMNKLLNLKVWDQKHKENKGSHAHSGDHGPHWIRNTCEEASYIGHKKLDVP